MIDEHGLVPDDADQAMWQRFLVNLAKYRTGATLTASIHDAIMVLGGNGIVEDFTILPRLLRDAMIIETWEGPHNTLCLQIMRDVAKSNLIDRWRAEISDVLGRWPKDFLSSTRSRFEEAFTQTLAAFSPKQLKDRGWAVTHARRVVDRLSGLLELAWLAEAAERRTEKDGISMLLASAARNHIPVSEGGFEGDAIQAPDQDMVALIDEAVFRPEHY